MCPRASRVLEMGGEVALISPLESDSSSLRRVLDGSCATIYWFPTCNAALAFLREHPLGVVISNVQVPDGCWKDLLDALSRLAHPPNLIVSSHLADERLWAEVLNLGGYDVLLTPFEPEEVLRVSADAWFAWKHTSTESLPPRKAAVSATDSHPATEEALAAWSGG